MSKPEHYVVATFRLSPFVFRWNVLALACSFIYLVSGTGQIPLGLLLISNAIFAVAPGLKWYNTKIILTNRRIAYHTGGGKAVADWSLFRDISYIEHNMGVWGKQFGYGNIEVVNQEKQSFRVDMLQNPNRLYEEVIELIDSYWIEKSPDYKPLGKRGNNVKLDSTDRIES